MNEPNETKQEVEVKQEAQPVNTDPPEETVGDIMKKSGSDAIKFWVIVVSAVVYLAGIVYAEVHGLTMLSKGVAADMKLWAQMGMVAAGISAVILPVRFALGFRFADVRTRSVPRPVVAKRRRVLKPYECGHTKAYQLLGF